MTTIRLTKEQPVVRLRVNAEHWEEGDVVDSPDGLGIVVEVRDEDFEGPGGTQHTASEDSPKYVVGLEDEEEAVGVYSGGDLSEDELPDTPVDDPVDDIAESETANVARNLSANESLTANQWDPPESWEESEIPARIIALDAWSSMGGQFNCGGACCMGTMRPDLGKRGAAEFCASFKDWILGGWEGWRSGG